MLPRFTVLVPTYRRHAALARCLASLAELDYPRDRVEVVVADDGSGDPPTDVVRRAAERMDVRLVVRERNGGPGAARNSGAEAARGEVLALIDDDCTADRGWLRALAARLAEVPPGSAVGGEVVNALVHNPFAEASQQLVTFLHDYYADPGRAQRRFFTTNNLALPLDGFRALGGFDTRQIRETAEDRDLCDRWVRSGRGLEYAPAAIVYHAHDLTLRTFCRQHYAYGRGAVYFHQARARRAEGGRAREPLSFYSRLVSTPLRAGVSPRRVLESALLVLSQAVYATGYLRERLLAAPRSR